MGKNYKFSWKTVYDSWAKLIRLNLNMIELTDKEKDIVVKRVEACTNCKEKTLNICGACGCYLPAKIIRIENKCKLDKWDSIKTL